jgi:hypothetical protein
MGNLPAGLRLRGERRRTPRVLGPGAFVRLFLLGVKVLALPDVSRQVAEHASVVMVAATTGCGYLPKFAAANDATESLTRGVPPGEGAAPKHDAIIFFGQTI